MGRWVLSPNTKTCSRSCLVVSCAVCVAVLDGLSTPFALIAARAKGIVPLPGVKTKAHADEIVGCLGWELAQEDVDILDAAHDVS